VVGQRIIRSCKIKEFNLKTLLVEYRSKPEQDNFVEENKEVLKEFVLIYANNTDVSGIRVNVIN